MKQFNLLEHLDAAGDKGFDIVVETERSQAGIFVLQPNGDTGESEGHDGDQIIYVESGEGKLSLEEEVVDCRPGDVIIIPAGTRHAVHNSTAKPLRMLTIYAPPSY